MEDTYVAYCLDQAVLFLGNDLQNELEQIPLGKGKKASERRAAKQQQRLMDILYPEQKNSRGRYRDPAEMLKGG